MGQTIGLLGDWMHLGRMCMWWISRREVVGLEEFHDVSNFFQKC